jgi:hypothetical protein
MPYTMERFSVAIFFLSDLSSIRVFVCGVVAFPVNNGCFMLVTMKAPALNKHS